MVVNQHVLWSSKLRYMTLTPYNIRIFLPGGLLVQTTHKC